MGWGMGWGEVVVGGVGWGGRGRCRAVSPCRGAAHFMPVDGKGWCPEKKVVECGSDCVITRSGLLGAEVAGCAGSIGLVLRVLYASQ